MKGIQGTIAGGGNIGDGLAFRSGFNFGLELLVEAGSSDMYLECGILF
jgi:hypothetical protein